MKKLIISLLTLLSLSTHADNLSFNGGFGFIDKNKSYSIGLEYKYDPIYKDLFIVNGLSLDILGNYVDLSLSPYKHTKDISSGRDISAYIGLGYKLNNFDIIGFYGLGRADKKMISEVKERSSRLDDFSTTYYNIANSTSLKESLGLKLVYNTSLGSSNFLKYESIKYGSNTSIDSLMFGLSFNY